MADNIKYEIILYWSKEDGAFIAEVPELPGCAADGATYQEALAQAELGDMGPFHRLLDVVSRPFDQRPGLERYTGPPPPGSAPHITYCGT